MTILQNNGQIEFLRNVYNDPVKFVRYVLRETPEPWQEEFLNNVAKHDRVSVRSANGVGKTKALSWIIAWFLCTRFPVVVAITAPGAPQIEAALWPNIRSTFAKLPPAMRERFDITTDRVVLKDSNGDSFAVARTGTKDRPEALQGMHSENLLLVVDEASGVPDIVFDYAGSSLSTAGAKVVLTSNPMRLSGYFYNTQTKWRERWTTQKVSAFDSKYSRDGSLIDNVRREDGEGSDRWRTRVLGEFPLQDEEQLISRAIVDEAMRRNDVEPIDAPIIWGLDVARQGSDRSALLKRQGNVVLEPVKTWIKLDTMQLSNIVHQEWIDTPLALRPEEIFVDVIGIGAGVTDRLRELIGDRVKGVNVAESPPTKERFSRLRDELWWRAREWFEARDCMLPDDPLLADELCMPKFHYEITGKIKIESKDEMRRRGERSPDLADAFTISLMNNAKDIAQRKRFFKALEIDYQWVL